MLQTIYTLLTYILPSVVRLGGVFNVKLKATYAGRKGIQKALDQFQGEQPLWIHVASYGEFEQIIPLIQKLKDNPLPPKIFVTVFSPSGIAPVQKNTLVDGYCYLPWDHPKSVRAFVEQLQPSLLIVVRQEFWYHVLKETTLKKIPVISFGSRFTKDHYIFKFWGRPYRKLLQKIDHFFLQDHASQKWLKEKGILQTTVAGDSRMDRVLQTAAAVDTYAEIDAFIGAHPCLVAGSTWPEDYSLFENFFNAFPDDWKLIIAPHEIGATAITALQKKLPMPNALWSEWKKNRPTNIPVLILDCYGMLRSIYAKATIAYVGGGMAKRGLHNILEPAAFGIPILIGPKHQQFREATDLIASGGVFSVSKSSDWDAVFHELQSVKKRTAAGSINYSYVHSKKGATQQLLAYLEKHKLLN